jgi:hypothetical protein
MQCFKHSIGIVIMIILAGNVRAGLWEPPVLNSSFESPLLAPEGWGYIIDDWFDVRDDQWDAWIEYATGTIGGNGIPVSPDPNQWAGLNSDGSSFYQQIGTYSGPVPVEVILYLGKRVNRTFVGLTVNLRVGGVPATAADNVSLDTVGATIVDTAFLSGGLELLGFGEAGAAEVTTTLNIPSGYTPGDALWIEFKGGNGQQQFFDFVRVGESVVDSDLVAHYLFNDVGNPLVVDTSGSGFHGTLMGGAQKVDDEHFKPGQVLSLNSNYVDIGQADIALPWTATMWVQRKTNPSESSSLLESSVGALRLEQWNNTKKVGVTRYGTGDFTFNYTAPLDTWVHLAFVASGSNTELWVNGILENTMPNTIDCPLDTMGSDGLDLIVALMDDVRVYDRALVGTEIEDVIKEAPLAVFPQPQDGATNVALDAILEWSAAPDGLTQTLYYGTQLDINGELVSPENAGNYITVTDGELTTPTSYDPGGLQSNTTYYWQVDTHYSGPSTAKGLLWTLTTNPCPKGDLNGDCIVDLRDLSIFVGQWMYPSGSLADMIGNDGVNLGDYALLALNWLKEELLFTGSFGSIDERYARDQQPVTGGSLSWSGTAWRGERLNAQIVLWSALGTSGVTCTATPLTDGGAGVIPASEVQTHFVKYVLTDGGAEEPDVLDTVQQVDMDAGTAQPIWILIDVPSATPAGMYQGQLVVSDDVGGSVSFTLNVEVLSRTLPDPANWSYHLDLWQNPWAVARYHNVTLWSQAHWDLLGDLLDVLADTGGKVITTTIVDTAWGGQTYDDYGSLVEWTKHTGGAWSYDYTLFDAWVEFCLSHGITKQINCYSMVPWGDNFKYYDEASSSYQTLNATAGSTDWINHWTPFLQDFESHLTTKGWLGKTMIAMDERPEPAMIAVIDLVGSVAPGLKVALAGNYHSSIEPDIDDMCVTINGTGGIAESLIVSRLSQGQETTFYVCCCPTVPNTFTSSPPAESTWLGWHAAYRTFTGMLRWAYNSWPADPLYDTRFGSWPAGDTFLVYPGPLSSIRFERMREGIQDYEKIRILRDTLTGDDLVQLENILSVFTYSQTAPFAEQVNTARGQLIELSR